MSLNPCTEPPQTATHNFPTNIYNKLGHSKSSGKWKNGRRKPSEGAKTGQKQDRTTNFYLPSLTSVSCEFSVLGRRYPLKRSQTGMKVDEGEGRQTINNRHENPKINF